MSGTYCTCYIGETESLGNPIIRVCGYCRSRDQRILDLEAAVQDTKAAARAEIERLTKLINTPEIIDFAKAIQIEAVHQRERWGSEHDDGKTAADWFWLIGYLAGKAIAADKAGDKEKLLHHIITTAAACANWHAQVLGNCNMRPGIIQPKGESNEPLG